jgi:hypothetical protein
MKLQKKHEVLDHLKAKDCNFKDLVANLFLVIDPDKRNYRELIWLMAMPDSLKKEASNIVRHTLSAIEPEPQTLGNLVESYPVGTMFDAIGLGKSYITEGPIFDASTNSIIIDEYACKELGKEARVSLPYDTKIRLIF